MYWINMVNHVKVVGSVVLAVVIAVVIIPQIQQSYTISYGSYPILSNNWWEALNWIKNNTEECSVISTLGSWTFYKGYCPAINCF